MPDREKLVVLIMDAARNAGTFSRYWAGVIAEHLLASGVVVLPCKVDTMAYYADATINSVQEVDIVYYEILSAEQINVEFRDRIFEICRIVPAEEFGKTLFLTREEAEKALKQMGGGENHAK